MLILSVGLTFFAVIYVGVVSSKVPEAHSKSIVGTFFTAILIGWFIINIFRILLATAFTPFVVSNENMNEAADGERSTSGFAKIIDFLFVPVDAKEIYRDMEIVHEALRNPKQDFAPTKKGFEQDKE